MPPRRPTAGAWTGLVYRTTTYDEPLWVNPNRRDGRWNLADLDCTQYFCLDPEAPFAEMLRGEDLQTEAEAQTFRGHLWQLRIDEGAIVDYGTFDRAEAEGFPPDALVDDDHERCQVEAQRLKGMGFRGVLAPNAALPGSTNLTLFGARSPIDWTTHVTLASGIPTQRLTQGAPPPGLTEPVRYYGRAHAGLSAFVQARKR